MTVSIGEKTAMDKVEIVAGSLEEAKGLAAERLCVDEAQVDLEVIEETKGLFGKGQVRVNAWAKPAKSAKAPRKTKAAKEEPTEPVLDQKKPEAKTSKTKKATVKAVVSVEEPAKDEEEVVATDQDGDVLLGYLQELIDLSGLDATAHISDLTGKYVNIEIDGEDASYLVGRRGEVLNALQYLMNVTSTRRVGNGVRVVLEADSYRTRREDVLRQLALDIAAQVRERKEEAVLDALPAFERRVIHQILSEEEGVTTYSEGEEPQRRVVIAPAE